MYPVYVSWICSYYANTHFYYLRAIQAQRRNYRIGQYLQFVRHGYASGGVSIVSKFYVFLW